MGKNINTMFYCVIHVRKVNRLRFNSKKYKNKKEKKKKKKNKKVKT